MRMTLQTNMEMVGKRFNFKADYQVSNDLYIDEKSAIFFVYSCHFWSLSFYAYFMLG